MSDEKTYPDCYLHVREAVSGEEWIRPLTGNTKLDLKRLVKRWIKEEFCGERFLDGELMPRLDGQFYAQIITDNRPPDSHVCWESGGFYIKDDPQPTRR
jgi:hypothetical protein